MINYAPIVLFTYNRPLHTKQVLNSLSKNIGAGDSILYVYCDGVKEDVSEEQLAKIEEVRDIVKNESRFKKVYITINKQNKGLANSIIDGVSEIVNKHGKVIILEDDIIVSKGFLKYMNDALNIYANEEKVGCIHAWNYDLKTHNYRESTFFLKGADCWGWATWKRSWSYFEPNGVMLLEQIVSKKQLYDFDRKGTHDYVEMLKAQIEGKIDSWAILWHASLFVKDMYCLHPTRTIVKNIGLDNSGVHCGILKINQNPVDFIAIHKINIQDSEWFYNSYNNYMNGINKQIKSGIKQKSKYILKQLLPVIVFDLFRKLKKGKQIKSKKDVWSGDYSSWEDAQINCTGYNSAIILEKCKNALMKVKKGEAVYERDSVLFDTIQYSWGLLAGLQKAALDNEAKLCVLDFGGSLGSTYYQNKEFLSGLKSLEWCIVEQAHFVDCGKENFENKHLKFYYTIEECLSKHKVNVLVLSSVLQYLPNINDWIDQFNNSNIVYILIDRTTTVQSDENIITIQQVPTTIYEASYPCWFFNHKYIQKKLTNYTLISSFKGVFDPVNYLLNGSVIANWDGYIFKKK